MLRAHRMGVNALCGVVLSLSLLVPAAAARPAPSEGWAFLVYLDADNNLDPYAYLDIAEMEAVGSTRSLTVWVLWDRYDGPAYLIRVQRGSYEVVDGFSLNGQEVNMGAASTLRAFVDFARSRLPPSRLALVLWDHGDDFRGFGWDDHPGDGASGVDFLTHSEIVEALMGIPLDILAFDGCVMGNIEVAYEYVARGLSITYLVASETYIPLEGYAYDGILSAAYGKKSLETYEFAKAFVDAYVDFYSGPGWQVGLSVIDMSRVEALVGALGALTDALRIDMARYRDPVASARGAAMLSWSLYGWEAYVDLVTWANALRASLAADAAIAPLADSLSSTLSVAVPYVGNTHGLDVKDAGGMGIFFPGSSASFKNNPWWYGADYLVTAFPYEGWLEFLRAYWREA